MAARPNLLDLRADSNQSNASSISRPLRSPRMHIAGEAPPELSPLDAFALQSRLLARQLQESAKEGNRMSRLPPLTAESPLMQHCRTEYFRSLSSDSRSDMAESPSQESGPGIKTEVEDAFEEEARPKSVHATVSHMRVPFDTNVPPLPTAYRDEPRGRQLRRVEEDAGLFGARRDYSPVSMHSDSQSIVDRPVEKTPSAPERSASHPSPLHQPISTSPDKSVKSFYEETGLAPPRSIFPKRSSSIMSSPLVPQEDELSISLGGSFHSLPPRKLSSGSAVYPNTAPSPAPGSYRRSPSVSSDVSALPRPSFNFSRPRSGAGTPIFDAPSRQASSDSQPSFVLADELAHTPISMHSDAFLDQVADDSKASSSYIYSKFTLPRGKSIQRSETVDSQSSSSQWERPQTSASKFPGGAPPSPPTRPSSSSARTLPDDMMGRPSFESGKVSMESSRFATRAIGGSSLSRPSVETSRPSEDVPRGRTLSSTAHDEGRARTPASAATSDSASTLRPSTVAGSALPSAAEMSAEDHVTKGVACHESGSLNESTYHFRIAARRNHPTAMLLYALACRHGWGMRPNQREGVEWLRKAAEFASIEIADEEDQAKEGKHIDVVEKKTRKAQFAFSIYQLGVSHMNGWGIEQDKALALRCFEIAGTWGDVDALAEAGFCWAQGIGCKKNLKRSAKFYRLAEAKGMSMVGNSWIHKAKYDDDDTKLSPKKDKKRARSKSRTRAMFGLNRSGA